MGSTKILTMAMAPFLFILVGLPCEFAVVPGVYIFLSTFSAAHPSKNLNLFLTSYYYVKVIVELEKNTNKEFRCLMVFIMRPSNNLKF